MLQKILQKNAKLFGVPAVAAARVAARSFCASRRHPTLCRRAFSTEDEKSDSLKSLRAWNQEGQWSRVISFVESQPHLMSCLRVGSSPDSSDSVTAVSPVDSSMLFEYVKALSQRLLKLPSPQAQPSLGSESHPLLVQVRRSRWSFWAFDIFRPLVTVLLFLSAASVVVENLQQNVSTPLGIRPLTASSPPGKPTTFEDVKGVDEAKDELIEIVNYLKDPERFTRLGARLPKGVLLSGPPGTGKTLLARAVAGEAKVPFLQASGSEFEEMFVGVGARRIRELFIAARKLAPAIIFIDEIDAVGARRAYKENSSMRMTLNQLLVELDGFQPNEGVIVICATNFAQALDPALTRPGRLDKTVNVPLPDLQGRLEILKLYGKKVVLAEDVDLSVLARRTAGMTGADLFNIINIAAIRCSQNRQPAVSKEALDDAFDRVVVGSERRNPMSEEEKRCTAYHEAGHALVSLNTKAADPVHKATIMPRGSALGITWQIPSADRYQHKLNELEARLDVLMGGRAAEALIFGEENVTAGSTSDLKNATLLARQMVMQFGMGAEDSKVPMYIESNQYGALSQDLRRRVDDAVQRLLDSAYSRASDLLKDKKNELEKLAKALVSFETLNGDEIQLAIDGECQVIEERRKVAASAAAAAEKQQKIAELATKFVTKAAFLSSKKKSSPL